MNYTRRWFLEHMNKAAAGMLLAGGLSCSKRAGDSRPNIIYILADDLGYAEVGCYGQEKIQTPNIDRIAREGLRFTQHYSGSPVCAPSRCVLMTGKHTGHATRRSNRPYIALGPGDITIAEVLKTAGYATGMVGKWHLSNTEEIYELAPDAKPDQEGFDYWFGCLHGIHAADYYPDFVWDNGEQYPLNGEVYTADIYAEKALDYIRANAEHPFFLYIGEPISHRNNLIEHSAESYHVPSDAPYSEKLWPQVEKNYAAMVTRMDTHIGHILDLLDELGIADNTMILFSSDNGGHSYKPHQVDFFNGHAVLRGQKSTMYEGGIRVPCVIRWSNAIQAGTVSEHVSAFQDVLPTLAEAAGVQPPDNIDGISFLPELLGKSQPDHEYLYWELNQKQAVRMGDWKALRNQYDQPVELYNLAEDVGERHNMAEQYPDIVEKAEKLFSSARTHSEHFSNPPSQ